MSLEQSCLILCPGKECVELENDREKKKVNKVTKFTSFLSSSTIGSDSFMTSPLCTPFSSYKRIL